MPDRINLKAICSEKETYKYSIDSGFFAQIEHSLAKGGNLDVCVEVRKSAVDDVFYVRIGMNGYIVTECDRCLHDLEIPVENENEVVVKFADHDEDAEDVVLVNSREGMLDIGALIYEFAVLSLPIHPVHEDGKCDADMIDRLNGMLVSQD